MVPNADNHFPRPVTEEQIEQFTKGYADFLRTSGISEGDVAKLLADDARLHYAFAAMTAAMSIAVAT